MSRTPAPAAQIGGRDLELADVVAQFGEPSFWRSGLDHSLGHRVSPVVFVGHIRASTLPHYDYRPVYAAVKHERLSWSYRPRAYNGN